MKTKLLLLTFLITTLPLSAQIIWTGGGGDINWNTAENWSSNTVPTTMDDVEIPSGFTVTIGGSAICQSLELQGSAILNIDTFGSFSSTQPSIFESGTTINWARGTINCSLLVNQGTMNLTSSADKLFETSTLVNNNGTINIIGTGDLFLRDGTVLNNLIDGTINMQADDGDIDDLGGLPIVNNAGVIRKSTSAGQAQIKTVELNNNGGIIQVDSGSLRIVGLGDKNFTGGSYIVSAGTVLDLDSTINVSGFLMGTIEGDLNSSNGITVSSTATFNFTGGGNFNWTGGAISGGGVLTNESIINLTGTAGKSILSTTLSNSGTLNILDTGDLSIGNGSIINNQLSGIIDLQTEGGNILSSGTSPNALNNQGLLRRTNSTGIAQVSVELNNSGIIEIQSGELEITNTEPFTNAVNGIVTGVGIIHLPLIANYTNEGTFAPGTSPGTLTIQGDYNSTGNAVLDIELNGLSQGADYDLLSITGNAEFNGSIQVTINFDADINDEFIVATTLGTINACNFPASVMASFGSNDYELTVECRNNNELVLTVLSETLSVSEEESFAVEVYPNPVSDLITVTNNAVSRITIFDIKGRNVLETKQKKFSLASLESGVYFLRAESDNNTYAVRKIIKN